MPVRRYTDLEAAERDLWIASSDPALGEHIRRVWSFAERFAPHAARGVMRIDIHVRAAGRIRPSEPRDVE